MAKTNLGLVEFCKQAVDKTGYVYGTIGQICTPDILNQCAKRYPANHLAGGAMRTVGNKWLGHRVTDCIGLIKYYVMSDKYGTNPQYIAKFDQSANGTFNNAKSKGVISTISETPGLLLHMDGHVGVYIGKGEVIEARGTYYGVVKTRLTERPWTHWYKSEWIEYVGAGMPAVGIDTTCDVIKQHGQYYTVKCTCDEKVTLTAGTADVVTIVPFPPTGNDQLFAIVAIGCAKQETGIFTAAPGEKPEKRFVFKIN